VAGSDSAASASRGRHGRAGQHEEHGRDTELDHQALADGAGEAGPDSVRSARQGCLNPGKAALTIKVMITGVPPRG
jgi:hypothetical protein